MYEVSSNILHLMRLAPKNLMPLTNLQPWVDDYSTLHLLNGSPFLWSHKISVGSSQIYPSTSNIMLVFQNDISLYGGSSRTHLRRFVSEIPLKKGSFRKLPSLKIYPDLRNPCNIPNSISANGIQKNARQFHKSHKPVVFDAKQALAFSFTGKSAFPNQPNRWTT